MFLLSRVAFNIENRLKEGIFVTILEDTVDLSIVQYITVELVDSRIGYVVGIIPQAPNHCWALFACLSIILLRFEVLCSRLKL
jgi:hypothetical protein